jgi:hypothetical protein
MSATPDTPEERFAALVEIFLADTDATLGMAGKKGFASSALCINGHIFAMLSKDRLVVKLPSPRVDALIARGEGQRFNPGHGRLMKEWLTVEPTSAERWLPLAREALAFGAKKR